MTWQLVTKVAAYLWFTFLFIRLITLLIVFYSTTPKLAFARRRLWWLVKRIVRKRISKNPFAYPTMVALELNPKVKESFINEGYNALAKFLADTMTEMVDRIRNPEPPKYPESDIDGDEHDFIDEWEEKEKQQVNPKLN